MFRVEVFVDDKRLSQLLHGFAGVILGEPKIQPVANGAVKAGKPVSTNSGELCDLFAAYAKKHKLEQFKAPQIREFCKSVGMSVGSYSYVLKRLYECKAIRKTGKSTKTVYTVVK